MYDILKDMPPLNSTSTAWWTEMAAAEAAEVAADVDGLGDVLDRVEKILGQIPDVTGGTRGHNAECWKRHTRCLALRLRETIDM